MKDKSSDICTEIYLAAKSSDNFDYSFWMSRIISWLVTYINTYLGILCVCTASIIILFLSFEGIFFVVPLLLATEVADTDSNKNIESYSPTIEFILQSLLIFCFLNIAFNYIGAIIVDAGKPEAAKEYNLLHNDLNTDEYMNNMINIDVNIDIEGGHCHHDDHFHHQRTNEIETCKQCDLLRPPRTHHCSLCRHCVLKMDHHCPWVNGCVGEGNYRYFVCFLFWVTVGTLIVCILTILTLALKTSYFSRQLEVFLETYGFTDGEGENDIIIDFGREGASERTGDAGGHTYQQQPYKGMFAFGTSIWNFFTFGHSSGGYFPGFQSLASYIRGSIHN